MGKREKIFDRWEFNGNCFSFLLRKQIPVMVGSNLVEGSVSHSFYSLNCQNLCNAIFHHLCCFKILFLPMHSFGESVVRMEILFYISYTEEIMMIRLRGSNNACPNSKRGLLTDENKDWSSSEYLPWMQWSSQDGFVIFCFCGKQIAKVGKQFFLHRTSQKILNFIKPENNTPFWISSDSFKDAKYQVSDTFWRDIVNRSFFKLLYQWIV